MIQTQTGKSVNLSKVVTDSNGVASVPIAGKPQFREIDKSTAQQVTKHVLIRVTPQLTSNNVLMDSFSIAMGIKSGPAGMIGILEGFLNHLKWQGTENFDLTVTDWVPGEVIGNLTVDVNASYPSPEQPSASGQTTIKRSLKIEATPLKLNTAGATQFSLPNVPADALNYLTDAQKAALASGLAKAQAQLQQANSQATQDQSKVQLYTVALTGGDWSMEVQDQSYLTQLPISGGEASRGTVHTESNATGNLSGTYGETGVASQAAIAANPFATPPVNYPGFTLAVHQSEGYVVLSIQAQCPTKGYYRHSDSQDPSQNLNQPRDGNTSILDGIEVDKAWLVGGGIKIPIKPATGNGISAGVTVPCTINGQKANLVISFSVTSKKKS